MAVDLLVTGAGGLIGSSLRKLCPTGVFVTRRDCDLRDLSRVTALFRDMQPARVLHLAGLVGGVRSNADHNADLFTDNVLINTNVLNSAQRKGVSRLVSVLASCAFAVFPDRPSTEEDLHVGMPFEGNLGYGCSKRMLDVHTKLLWQQYGCRFSTIAPVTMYGPNDNFDLEHGHVIGALIHKVIRAKERGEALVVWGSGQAIRQFVYVDDVARLLLRSVDSFRGPETVIIAPDSGLRIRELVDKLVSLAHFDGPVVFDRSQPEGVRIKRLQSMRFAERFPAFGFTPIEEGLATTLEWFIKHASEAAVT